MRSVKGRWGEVWYYGKDEYVGRSLHNYGEYNPDETEMIIDLARAGGGLCLDIGANFGVMAQALIASGFPCLAFEPQPDVYDVLIRNVDEKYCFNIGLGSIRATMKMPKILRGSKANYGGQGIGTRSELGTIDVNVVPLDSMALTDVGFMKIDVEGFEEEVLRGATETINKYKPIMYIEDDRREKSKSLREYITELGYTIEEHRPGLFRPDNFFNNKVNVWAPYQYVSHNLICKPIC